MIKRIKAWLKARRIKRFRARFAEAYPDAEKFFSKLAWLDGTDQFIIDAIINVPDILLWSNPAHSEEDVEL